MLKFQGQMEKFFSFEGGRHRVCADENTRLKHSIETKQLIKNHYQKLLLLVVVRMFFFFLLFAALVPRPAFYQLPVEGPDHPARPALGFRWGMMPLATDMFRSSDAAS